MLPVPLIPCFVFYINAKANIRFGSDIQVASM